MSEQTSALPTFAKHSALGVIAGAVSGGILSVVSSFIAYSVADPNSLIKPLGTAAFFVSAVICGMFSSKRAGKNPFAGLVSGAVFIILLTAISFAVPGEETEIGEWILMRLGGIAASFFGGIIVSIKKDGKKRRRTTQKKSSRRR
jgi:putative membrane protein (TIGR04086 family)